LLVAGHSAGAHLAAMLMCCRWAEVEHRLPQRPLCGALALSGLYELAPLREVSFLQPDLRLTATDVSRLSPARMPAPEGPLCTLVGALESEEYLRQNQLLQQVWGRQAVPLCASLPGLHHFSVLNSLADPDGVAYRWVLQTLGLD
jgi:arylformamidase